jgi:hypothetical protein
MHTGTVYGKCSGKTLCTVHKQLLMHHNRTPFLHGCYSYLYNISLFALYWILVLSDYYYVIICKTIKIFFLVSLFIYVLHYYLIYDTINDGIPVSYNILSLFVFCIFTKVSICVGFTLSYVPICLPILFWKLAAVRILIPIFASLFVSLFDICSFF